MIKTMLTKNDSIFLKEYVIIFKMSVNVRIMCEYTRMCQCHGYKFVVLLRDVGKSVKTLIDT